MRKEVEGEVRWAGLDLRVQAVTQVRLLTEALHWEMEIVNGIARFYSLQDPGFRTSSPDYKDNAQVANEEGGLRRVKRRERAGFGVRL